MADLLYFASLRERLGAAKEQLTLPENVQCIGDLKNYLSSRGGIWADTFTDNTEVLVSVNQQMVDNQSSIQDDDEIAFFPPVTGG